MIGTTIIVEFQSAISRYLVSNPEGGVITVQLSLTVSIRYIAVLGLQPYLKNAPSDQRRTKRFTHPRRIDHIPTFASLNSDKNTRSTHYTPNAGIELSETTPLSLRVNPVQNHS